MIPDHPVDISVPDVPPRPLRSFDADDVSDGIAMIHDYEPSVFVGATWEVAREMYAVEAPMLDQADTASADEEDYYEAAGELAFEAALGFELGVASAVLALCAGGCATFASCGGHEAETGGRSQHPWILLACDPERYQYLAVAARSAGCGLDIDERGLVFVVAPSARFMLRFAKAVMAIADDFDALPDLVDRDDVRLDEDYRE